MTKQIELTLTTFLHSPKQLSTLSGETIGLVSIDELILKIIGIHPLVFSANGHLSEELQQAIQQQITERFSQQSVAFAEYYVSVLTEQLVNAAQYQPNEPLKVCLSGADSSYRHQLLGSELAPSEVNPLMGLRGVSCYAQANYRQHFALQCEAIKRARSTEGATNIELVVPFVRTFSEAATMIDLLAEQGLCRGANGLKVHLLCDLPATALLAPTFLQYFDGMVVDIEQLAQFTLGQDLNNEALNYLPDGQNDAIKQLLQMVFIAINQTAKQCDIYCRHIKQAPNFQRWLTDHEITTVIC